MNDFVAFIISNRRADNVYTYDTLRKCGYTGRIIVVIDDEDPTAKDYFSKFGRENVEVFNKKEIASKVDNGDNFNDLRTTTHARNATFDIAERLGYKYFIQLDDDYTNFRWRFIDGEYITKGSVNDLDGVFEDFLEFYKETNFLSIAFAQGGDFIGGESCGMLSSYSRNSRKCMNSFICSTDRRFWFISRMNEDVNTYITLGNTGELFLTIPFIGLEQKQTQSTKGGMTETYLENGTYQKSFFSVMYKPSFTKVSLIGQTSKRLHHSIKWDNAVPKIINEKHKKNGQ